MPRWLAARWRGHSLTKFLEGCYLLTEVFGPFSYYPTMLVESVFPGCFLSRLPGIVFRPSWKWRARSQPFSRKMRSASRIVRSKPGCYRGG